MAAVEAMLTDDGQITIPAEIRSRLGWKPRDRVIVEVDGDGLKLRAAEPSFAAGSTLAAGFGAVPPFTRPEDFRWLREQFEEDVATVVATETE